MIRKGLAVCVILLFIGVAFAPSINASVVDDELVEFDIEFCGLGKKHTVKLTQQVADEVEQLFDDIEQRLFEVETREESEIIFKGAVVELDRYGLLGGMSVKHVQRLVTGGYQNQKIMNIIDDHIENNQNIFDNQTNALCLIAGEINHANIYPLILSIILYFVVNCGLDEYVLMLIFMLMEMFIIGPYYVSNVAFVDPIIIGNNYSPAYGWVFTIGLRGIKYWDGAFYGQMSTIIPRFWWGIDGFLGVRGFTGIKVIDIENHQYFYLGTALKVKIGYEPPD